jgi:5-(carboxyamino)imidazole ribonucleotide mutase
MAAAILALVDPRLARRLDAWREAQTMGVPETPE